MIEWDYSRNQLLHEGYINDPEQEFFVCITPTNLKLSMYGKARAKFGYDLYKGDRVNGEFIKHAKTVQELKEFAEEEYGSERNNL